MSHLNPLHYHASLTPLIGDAAITAASIDLDQPSPSWSQPYYAASDRVTLPKSSVLHGIERLHTADGHIFVLVNDSPARAHITEYGSDPTKPLRTVSSGKDVSADELRSVFQLIAQAEGVKPDIVSDSNQTQTPLLESPRTPELSPGVDRSSPSSSPEKAISPSNTEKQSSPEPLASPHSQPETNPHLPSVTIVELPETLPHTDPGLIGKIPGLKRVYSDRLTNDHSCIVTRPPKNAMLISAMYPDVDQCAEYLDKQGFKIIGILGTGPVGKVSKDQVERQSPFYQDKFAQAGYHYLNLGRLRGHTPAEAIRDGDLLQQDFDVSSGLITTQDGKTRRLDFNDLKDLSRKERIRARNQRLAELEKDPNVVAISLDAWQAGEVSGEGRRDVPLGRSLTAYDEQGELLGHVVTGAIGLQDEMQVARLVFGNQVKSIDNLDGDFYAQMWVPGSPYSSETTRNFKFARLLIQPKNEPASGDGYQSESPDKKADRKKDFNNAHTIQRIKNLVSYLSKGKVGAVVDAVKHLGDK